MRQDKCVIFRTIVLIEMQGVVVHVQCGRIVRGLLILGPLRSVWVSPHLTYYIRSYRPENPVLFSYYLFDCYLVNCGSEQFGEAVLLCLF